MENFDTAKLEQEHKRLEESIDDEYSRPAPDTARLAQLKRQKLQVKDQISAGKPAQI